MLRGDIYTAGQLKRALRNVPDDAPVILGDELEGCANYATFDNGVFVIGCIDELMEEDEDDPDTGEYDTERDMALWD